MGTWFQGIVDPGYPKYLAWGWGDFAQNGNATLNVPGIDAALYSGSKCYFFSANRYVRVTRGDTGPGTVDPGYPKNISAWGWGDFGRNSIDAALYSGSKCYFFAGDQVNPRDPWGHGSRTVHPVTRTILGLGLACVVL